MYLFSALHGQGTSLTPSARGIPTECRQGTNAPSAPNASSAPVPHAGHDPHAHRHIGGVGELHPDLALVGAERSHRERDHVHRAAPHRAGEQLGERLLHLCRITPVVRRPRFGLGWRADERAVLNARHVARVGERKVGVRPLGLRELAEGPRRHQCAAQAVVLLRGPVAPMNLLGLGEGRDILDPRQQALVLGGWQCRSSGSSLLLGLRASSSALGGHES